MDGLAPIFILELVAEAELLIILAMIVVDIHRGWLGVGVVAVSRNIGAFE